MGIGGMSPTRKHDSQNNNSCDMGPFAVAIAAHNLKNQSSKRNFFVVTMNLIWSAWTIAIGVIATPHIHASTTKDDYKGRILLERENELTGGGSLMRTKKLRNERDLSAQSRVVGGQDADIGKYPFFVEWDGCGASLVHKGKCPRVILLERTNRPFGDVDDTDMRTSSYFQHIQTLSYQRLIVLRSHPT
jgi:hypothetical protein